MAVVIYQYDLSRSTVTLNSAEVLAELGYAVDIYVGWEEDRVGVEGTGNIRIRTVLEGKVRRRRNGPFKVLQAVVSPLDYIVRLLLLARSDNYDFVFGINSYGLIAATVFGMVKRAPVAYRNLEMVSSILNPRSKTHWLEAWCSRRAVFTTVQSEEKGEVTKRENGIKKSQLVIVPDGARGPAEPGKSKYLHRKLGLSEETRIVVYAGGIDNKQFRTLDLARVADKSLPPGWVFVIHGWGADEQEMTELFELSRNGKLYLSTDVVSYSELGEILRSADIGVALYGQGHPGQRFIGTSSQKLAHYLKYGIPVLVSAQESLKDVVEACECGVSLPDDLTSEALRGAIGAIDGQYAEYARNAVACFDAKYNFDQGHQVMVERMQAIMENRE